MKNFYPQQIRDCHLEDVWKRAPVAFETCWDMRKWKAQGWDIEQIFDWALQQHASLINNKSAPVPEGTRPLVEKLLKRLGYRFVLRELRHPASVERESELGVEMDWENVGVAPCYADYVAAVSLVDESGKRAWTGTFQPDARKWLPGNFSIEGSFRLPTELAPGSYRLEVGVLEPKGLRPVVRLAIEGRAADGWYPVSRLFVR